MDKRRRQEAGFTLIELLTVVATLGALVTLSMQNYDIYKDRIYNAQGDNVMRQVKMAVEGGKIDMGMASNPADPNAFAWARKAGAAAFEGVRVNDLLPGYSHDNNMFIFVEYDGICDAGFAGDWCQSTFIQVHHCNLSRVKSWSVLKNGQEIVWEVAGGVSC